MFWIHCHSVKANRFFEIDRFRLSHSEAKKEVYRLKFLKKVKNYMKVRLEERQRGVGPRQDFINSECVNMNTDITRLDLRRKKLD